MRTLMISLDERLLETGSAVAKRLSALANTDIIVPSTKKLKIKLSDSVTVLGTGGNKLAQFFGVIKIGKELIKDNEYGLITTQDPFMTALVGLMIRKRTPLEIQVHGDFFSNLTFVGSSPKNWCYYWLARLITLREANQIRVVGERVKQSLVKMGLKAPITVRPVTLDLGKIKNYQPAFSVKNKYPGFKKYFAYVGRLEKEKNLAWLITVFSEYLQETKSNDVLLVVGDGSQKMECEKLVKKNGQEKNIIFVGWVSEPFDYLKTVDCVLVPSLAEGYGLTAMETAAAGTKLIMTDVGVANFELKASDTVVIVPTNSSEKFVSALKQV